MQKTSIPYLYRKTRPRLPALLLMSAANMGSALFGVLFALGTRRVINTALGGGRQAFLKACCVQAAIILGSLVCLTLYRWLHDRLAADLDRDWKQGLLHGLLQGEYEQVSRYHTGELLNRLNNDVRIACDGLLATLPGLLSMLTRLTAAAAVLTALEPRFTALLAALAIVVVIATGLARRRLKALHKAVSQADGRLSGFLQETLELLLPVQAMDVQDEIERRAAARMDERYTLQRKRRRITLFANTGVSLLSYISSFGALVWCARGILHGTMSFGDLTAVTQLVSQLRGPMVNLSGFYPKLIAMTAAAERLMEIDTLCDRTAETQGKDLEALYAEMQSIRAENLSFTYGREGEQVLHGGSFEVPKGSFAVITGPSGVGKSTLLKLMLGIFKPKNGRLYLHGTGGESTDLDRTTRRLFAYVPQGSTLMSGTLRENLLLTRPEASAAEIKHAIFVSGMDAFLPSLPDGLDTMLGENAHGLSEGQAQRLAIARAVLGNAPILLLDECTSALDADTERSVLQRLAALPDRTCIAVTHRPAALELADLKLELHGGSIEEK